MPTPTETPMLAPADSLCEEASVVAWAPAMSILLADICRPRLTKSPLVEMSTELPDNVGSTGVEVETDVSFFD
ncbi:hypothetical protein [Rhizobium sp. BK376]|uniref:hypothetical protein n=1 Tax=Rhizobium sp. BK376 TaxID=2512149 RepID=UPI001FDED81F|nr:hypothetical protein [Rhizobium sp. BK376]